MSASKEIYRYRVIPTGDSSAKYGNCEVCHKPVSDVVHQVEERQFELGWTQYQCSNLFGHESCLRSRQRPGRALNPQPSA